MPNLLRDARHAVRLLRRRPGFTLTATATIALAIAANTVVYGLVRGILLNPLPLPAPAELVRIEQTHAAGVTNVTGATFHDIHTRSQALESIAAFRTAPATFSTADQALPIVAALVTSEYVALLRTAPLAGRLPEPGDFTRGAEPVVFLAAETWRKTFDGDRAAIGRSVLVNAAPRTVAGVIDVPASTPGAADIFLPYDESSAIFSNRRARLFTVIARLRPGITVDAATAELAAVAATIVREAPQVGLDMSLLATPLRDRIGQPLRSSLLLLWSAVGLLMLIAFANVANLLLMEGSVRERELTVRTALGAPRAALMRLLAVEAAVAGSIGGVAGALLGAWGLAAIRTALPPSLPRVSDVHVDFALVASGVIVAIVATLAFGLVPAARASRRDAAAALRNRESSASGSRVRDALVAGEVALTLVLLFGAGLLGRSLWAAARTPMGFDTGDVVTVDLSLPGARYAGSAAHALFYGSVIERLASTPGVESAGVTGALPLTPTAATTIVTRDLPDDQQPMADVVTASPGFFTALRLPLLRGRGFAAADRAGAPPVALVNETAARTLWPAGTDPIGRTLEMRDWGAPYRATVIGIIGDVKQAGADRSTRAAIYYPFAQFPQTTLTQTIVVRSRGPVADTVARVRAAVREIDPQQPLGVTAPMSERVSAALAPRRFDLILLGAFGLAALLLAGVGVYGIVAFAMAARAREIGIRIALGASPAQIARLAIGKGATPIVFGVAGGAAASWLCATAVSSLLYGVAPRDALSLAIAAALIAAAGIAAITGPALKALRIDPAISFRLP